MIDVFIFIFFTLPSFSGKNRGQVVFYLTNSKVIRPKFNKHYLPGLHVSLLPATQFLYLNKPHSNQPKHYKFQLLHKILHILLFIKTLHGYMQELCPQFPAEMPFEQEIMDSL